jgi:outer membrane cobalamin receptor
MLQSRFRSDFYSLYGWDVDSFQSYYHDPVALIDFKISANIMEHAVITFSLDNVLDAQTSVVSTYWMNGRTWRLGYYWELFD